MAVLRSEERPPQSSGNACDANNRRTHSDGRQDGMCGCKIHDRGGEDPSEKARATEVRRIAVGCEGGSGRGRDVGGVIGLVVSPGGCSHEAEKVAYEGGESARS